MHVCVMIWIVFNIKKVVNIFGDNDEIDVVVFCIAYLRGVDVRGDKSGTLKKMMIQITFNLLKDYIGDIIEFFKA